MLFAPLLLQSRGLSKQVVKFLLNFLYLIVSLIVALNHEEQKALHSYLGRLPRSAEQLYNMLDLESAYTCYICCTNCFMLYNIETLQPLTRPRDNAPKGPVPWPPPNLPENRTGSVTPCQSYHKLILFRSHMAP